MAAGFWIPISLRFKQYNHRFVPAGFPVSNPADFFKEITMARKNEKLNDKEIIEEAGKETAKKAEKKNVKARFKNSYIGTHGIFYAGKEYDLDDGLYNLFKDEAELL